MEQGALTVAVVGVLGTLLSPVVGQWLGRLSRQEENRFLIERSLNESHDVRAGQLFEQRRTCYININAASRRYRIALMNYLHRVREDHVSDDDKRDLRETRHDYMTSLAELQMTAPLYVLEATKKIDKGLSWAYRAVRQLETGKTVDEGGFNEIDEFLVRLWDEWHVMQTAMRRDLRVTD